MSQQLADRFMAALHQLELTRNPGVMNPLFAEGASLCRIPQAHSVRTAITEFWSEYLNLFDEIETRFENVIIGERGIVLEWHSSGTLRGGHHVDYEGVSVLEHEGCRIKHFRTYYDASNLLGRRLAKTGS